MKIGAQIRVKEASGIFPNKSFFSITKPITNSGVRINTIYHIYICHQIYFQSPNPEKHNEQYKKKQEGIW